MDNFSTIENLKQAESDINSEGNYSSQKAKMTREATNLLAARVLSDPNFPNEKTLPRFFPTPFNNFGHYFLCDYERLLKIIWDATEQFKSQIKAWHVALPWTAFIVGFIPIFIYMSSTPYMSVDVFVSLAIIPFILLWLFNSLLIGDLKNRHADFRANLIRELLNDNWKPTLDKIPQRLFKNFQLIGSGEIEADKSPVVIMHDNSHPFPGYGQLQIENQFLCRKEDKTTQHSISEDKLFQEVINEIKRDLNTSGISNYSTGSIISIHGKSVDLNSQWLDEQRIPLLYKKINHEHIHGKPLLGASFRKYFVVQILLPKYMTAASFFIRPYIAENSAACQISVTTLGPTYHTRKHFEKRLAKYESEKEKRSLIKILRSFLGSSRNGIDLKSSGWKLFRELLVQRVLGRDISIFRNGNLKLKKIRNLDVLSLKTLNDPNYSKEYEKAIHENVSWPGQYHYPTNIRETNSTTFTSDYFGRQEAISSIKTIYDQISRSILDSMEELGFDVSDYKNKDGVYSINADKIEQIIVGKKIRVTQDKPNTKSGKLEK